MPGEKIHKQNGHERRLPTLEELMVGVDFPSTVARPHVYTPGSLAAEAVLEGYRMELRDRRRHKGDIALKRTIRAEFDILNSED